MKIATRTLLAFLLGSMALLGSAAAQAAPASDASIKQLLEVTEAKKLVEGLRGQVDSYMTNAVQRELKGQQPTPKQQKAIDKMKNSMVAVVQKQLSWEKMEPMYLRLYKESFTEEDLSGMLAFYKTPAGQAVIHKMPGLMRNVMVEMQNMMAEMNPQMQEVMRQFSTDIKAAGQ